MPRQHSLSGQHQSPDEIALYHRDLLASLEAVFVRGSAATLPWYVGSTHTEMLSALAERRDELARRSSLALLAAIEAAFRVDFLVSCSKRRKDPLSRALRDVHKQHGPRASLEDHILPRWREHILQGQRMISEIARAFKYRHWLAHGRYWTPKLPRKFTYDYVYSIVNSAVTQLPFDR